MIQFPAGLNSPGHFKFLFQIHVTDKYKYVGVNIFSKSGSFLNMLSWLVGCLGLNGPLRQYFSLYRAVFQREEERNQK